MCRVLRSRTPAVCSGLPDQAPAPTTLPADPVLRPIPRAGPPRSEAGARSRGPSHRRISRSHESAGPAISESVPRAVLRRRRVSGSRRSEAPAAVSRIPSRRLAPNVVATSRRAGVAGGTATRDRGEALRRGRGSRTLIRNGWQHVSRATTIQTSWQMVRQDPRIPPVVQHSEVRLCWRPLLRLSRTESGGQSATKRSRPASFARYRAASDAGTGRKEGRYRRAAGASRCSSGR